MDKKAITFWITVGTAFLGVIITVAGYIMSLEVRIAKALDVNERLTNIEEMMRPVIVDYKVQKELEKTGFHRHSPDTPPEPIENIRERWSNNIDSQINDGRKGSR